AIILVRNLGAVRDHHVVEQMAVIWLVDLRGALHRFRGQADLVADKLRTGLHLAFGHLRGDRVGVIDVDVGPGLGELDRLLALLLCPHENVGGFLAIGSGQHDRIPLTDRANGNLACDAKVYVSRSAADDRQFASSTSISVPSGSASWNSPNGHFFSNASRAAPSESKSIGLGARQVLVFASFSRGALKA